MAHFGKTYKFVRAEKFRDFLESLKVPEERIEAALKDSPSSQKLEKNGDDYTLVTIDSNGTKTVNFKNGVEFEEILGEKYHSKTKFIVDDNVVTQVLNLAKENVIMTIKRVYTENELVAYCSTSNWDGPAIRFYTAV